MNYMKTKSYDPSLKQFWFNRRQRLKVQLQQKNNLK